MVIDEFNRVSQIERLIF